MQITERIRREIRELAARAEELELSAALRPLADDFKRWEKGEIHTFDLKDRIHRFHQGPARKIYLNYSSPQPELFVARAIVEGMLDRAAISAELLAELEPLMAFMRERQAEADG